MTGTGTRAGRFLPFAVFGVLLAVHVAAGLWWLDRNSFPLNNDYLNMAAAHASHMAEGLMSEVRLAASPDYYPPLYPMLFGAFQLAFGDGLAQTLLFQLLLVFASAIGIHAIGRALDAPRTGLFAAALFLVYQGTWAFVLMPGREILVGTASVLCLWALIRSKGLRRKVSAIAFGLLFGAGMLAKWTFVGYVAAPIVAILLAHREDWRQPGFAAGLALAALAAAVVAGPWYLFVLDWPYFFQSMANDPVAMSLTARLTTYMTQLSVHSGIAWHTVLFVPLFALCLFTDSRKRMAPVLVWFAGAYAVFTAFPHTEERYVLPLLPPMALITAAGARRLPTRFAPVAVLIAMIAAAGCNWYETAHSPRVPIGSGAFVKLPGPECKTLTRAPYDALWECLEKNAPDGRRRVVMARHPFNRDPLYFRNDDLLYLTRMQAHDAAPIALIVHGFALEQYDLFLNEIDATDFVLVEQRVLEWDRSTLEEYVRRSVEFIPPRETLTVDYDDPGLMETIASQFEPACVLESPCHRPVTLFRRIGGATDSRD